MREVRDVERIENINYAMLAVLESKYKLLGLTYVIEDGRITGIVYTQEVKSGKDE